MKCPSCGSFESAVDGNTTFCAQCGRVLEESAIISEIGFAEGTNGAASVVGQFVSSTGSVRSAYRKGYPNFARDSREATIDNGRRRIQQVAATLRLNNHHVEAAQRLFMLAVQHNFIQGRRTQNVVAACLYIVCRREKTPHMLIDFSDVLQTNVYVLGHTFLKFCRLLNLQLPIIDPSLYIQRFASKLEFEEKTTVVANTALRLVQRMKRDWIQTGRRPSGICGAALLISARLHGFRRTQREIIQVVRICDVTLRKRLIEFEETPSGGLTPEEFESIDLEEECDPPAYTRGLKKQAEEEKKALAIKQLKLMEEGEEEEGETGGNSESKKEEESSELPEEIQREMDATLNSEEFKQIEEDEDKRSKQDLSTHGKEKTKQEELKFSSSLEDNLTEETSTSSTTSSTTTTTSSSEKRKTGHEASEGQEKPEEPEVNKDEDFSDINDGELEAYLNSNEEEKAKTEIWTELNRDYLEMMAERAEREKEAIAQGKQPVVRKKRKRDPKKDTPAESAAEAALEMLKKKVSNKINYSALEGLFAVDESLFDHKTSKLEKLRSSGPTSPMMMSSKNEDDDEELRRPRASEYDYDDDDD